MVEIKTIKKDGKILVKLDGQRMEVLNEISMITQKLSKENDDIADALLLGILTTFSKEQIIEKLDKIQKAKDIADDLFINGLLDTLKRWIKDE